MDTTDTRHGATGAATPDLIAVARALAERAHAGQMRKDGTMPYIEHPRAVAGILARAGYDESVVAAGWLHDVIEDTEAGAHEIAAACGTRVLALVEGASEPDKTLGWYARKMHTIDSLQAKSLDVHRIIAADKLHNVSTLIADVERGGSAAWARFRAPRDAQAWYFATIAHALSERHGEPVFGELKARVTELFGQAAVRHALRTAPGRDPIEHPWPEPDGGADSPRSLAFATERRPIGFTGRKIASAVETTDDGARTLELYRTTAGTYLRAERLAAHPADGYERIETVGSWRDEAHRGAVRTLYTQGASKEAVFERCSHRLGLPAAPAVHRAWDAIRGPIRFAGTLRARGAEPGTSARQTRLAWSDESGWIAWYTDNTDTGARCVPEHDCAALLKAIAHHWQLYEVATTSGERAWIVHRIANSATPGLGSCEDLEFHDDESLIQSLYTRASAATLREAGIDVHVRIA